MPAEGGTPTQVTAGSGHYRSPQWSPDGRALLIQRAYRTPAQDVLVVARVGAFRVPAAGGAPRLVLRFDDPTHRWHRASAIRVHGDRLYFTLGDQQSDIWMTEIAAPR